MINGLVVGVVIDNVDPSGMHRVHVQYPVDSESVESSWVRQTSPMAGKNRGMVMLPDTGTEVVLGFTYRTMSPMMLGAVYNGAEDKPEPYKNDDSNNDKRVFWSRNDHMVIFDDTEGAERVQFGAGCGSRLDVKSGPIYQDLDPVEKVITMYSDKDMIVEAKETLSVKCKDFKLEASKSIQIGGGRSASFKSTQGTKVLSESSNQTYKGATRVDINPSATPPDPKTCLTLPTHSHPPSC